MPVKPEAERTDLLNLGSICECSTTGQTERNMVPKMHMTSLLHPVPVLGYQYLSGQMFRIESGINTGMVAIDSRDFSWDIMLNWSEHE